MRLDHYTIITALLHDTVEDTNVTVEEIGRMFGKEIASLVDGVTKLSRIDLVSDNRKQAENFRKLVIAMSDDIRVLLVKLADRLHNMRTLHFISDKEKRRRIAFETMDIYSPLAERIGIHELKDELEFLAFKELNEDAFETVTSRLDVLVREGSNTIKFIENELLEKCHEGGIKLRSRDVRNLLILYGRKCSERVLISSNSQISLPFDCLLKIKWIVITFWVYFTLPTLFCLVDLRTT